jgi:hypothetical protein
LYLGGLPAADGASTNTWQGLIDDVRLYRTAQNPSQITAEFQDSLSKSQQPLASKQTRNNQGSATTTNQSSSSAAAGKAARLTVRWRDNSVDEDGFEIERKAGSTGKYTQIAKVGANITSYVDSSVTFGATYCYRVRAANSSTVSSYSSETCSNVP